MHHWHIFISLRLPVQSLVPRRQGIHPPTENSASAILGTSRRRTMSPIRRFRATHTPHAHSRSRRSFLPPCRDAATKHRASTVIGKHLQDHTCHVKHTAKDCACNSSVHSLCIWRVGCARSRCRQRDHRRCYDSRSSIDCIDAFIAAVAAAYGTPFLSIFACDSPLLSPPYISHANARMNQAPTPRPCSSTPVTQPRARACRVKPTNSLIYRS